MVIDSSVINTLRAFVSRYFSAAEKGVSAKEIKVPDMGALVSPE
jgi:hypothetical protein